MKIGSLFLAVSIVMLSGCGSSSDTELARYINQVKLRPAKKIEPIPEFKPAKQFIFPENDIRRSPFKPMQVEKKSQINAPNLNRQKGPLEAFPLDALKFVGTLKEGQELWALMQEPGGLITRVKIGDYLGKNYGELLSIQDKVIKIEETIQVEGRWEKKIVIMNLRGRES